jgi:hypothetical protein
MLRCGYSIHQFEQGWAAPARRFGQVEPDQVAVGPQMQIDPPSIVLRLFKMSHWLATVATGQDSWCARRQRNLQARTHVELSSWHVAGTGSNVASELLVRALACQVHFNSWFAARGRSDLLFQSWESAAAPTPTSRRSTEPGRPRREVTRRSAVADFRHRGRIAIPRPDIEFRRRHADTQDMRRGSCRSFHRVHAMSRRPRSVAWSSQGSHNLSHLETAVARRECASFFEPAD